MSAQEVPIRLLHKLGELYGDNPPGVVGFSVESKDCPDFIGGVYINDRDTLVIQIGVILPPYVNNWKKFWIRKSLS